MRLHADGHLFVGIEDDDVGIAPHRDRPLLGKEPEDFRRRGGDDLHESVD